jgi:thiamine-monophosphate kinase
MNEDGPIGEDAWLGRALAAFPPVPAHVTVGPGHDAAVLHLVHPDLVVAKDVLVEGVHFDLATCTPGQAARKAVAVNLSDLAACGALPVGFLVGGVLPAPPARALFDALMRGFADASREFDLPCVGGDTNVAASPLVLSVTVLGRPGPRGLVDRSGARVGQLLSVTGPLGGSLGGRHLAFRPRLEQSQALLAAEVPSAMMDLSDGLSRDLPRLCRMSGVGALLHGSAIPVHADANPQAPLEAALHDGEDFELLLAHDPLTATQVRELAASGVTLHRIGEVVERGRGVLLETNGEEAPLRPLGFDHFG